MKSFLIVTFILSTILATGIFARNISLAHAGNGFALVELFTSEGCSSCPPADDAVADIAKEFGNQVIVLGYHVDYWDHLGWKDAYSQSYFTDRQKSYANFFKLNSIYTPQVVVNGQSEFVGSDRTRLKEEVLKAVNANSKGMLELTAQLSEMKKVVVHYKAESLRQQVLNFAIIELKEQTKVTAGENAGRQLHHVNIVRDFITVSNPQEQGNITLNIPSGLATKDCQVIGFAQNKYNWMISAAAKIDIREIGH